jgi:hypothetical protein
MIRVTSNVVFAPTINAHLPVSKKKDDEKQLLREISLYFVRGLLVPSHALVFVAPEPGRCKVPDRWGGVRGWKVAMTRGDF